MSYLSLLSYFFIIIYYNILFLKNQINGNLSDKQDKTDNGIKTAAKTVVGGINELLNKFTSYYTKSESDNLLANKTNTKVKGNAESTYRTGDVNLTPANIGAVAQGGDGMNGVYTVNGEFWLGKPTDSQSTLSYWRDSTRVVWAGTRADQNNNWFLWDALNNRGVVVIPKSGSPVFNGQVAWSNVTSKPALVQGYSASGSFYAVTSFGKFADSNNLLANSAGGSLYWGGNAWSDERLKKNIDKTKVNGLDRINKINVVEYDFKDNKKYGGFHEIGFIAQELREIIPDAVLEVPADDEDKKEYNTNTLLTINDSQLVPYLIKAVQELSEEVDKLKNK